MTTRLRLALTLIAALLAMPAAVTAQDLDATTTSLAIADLDGVEEAVSRTYTMDVADIIRRIEDGTEPTDPLEGPILLLGLVARFDTPEHAADAVAAISDRLRDSPPAASIPVEVEETDDLGETGIAFTGTRQGGTPVTLSGYAVQDDTWLYLAMAVSEDESSAEAARAVVEFGLGRAASAEDPAYLHTGRSSGGIWEKLPGSSSNGALVNTQPIYDALLVTEPADD